MNMDAYTNSTRFVPVWKDHTLDHAIFPDPAGRTSQEEVPADLLELANITYGENKHARTINHLCSFHLFPKLPPELRRMVWRHTLPGPRVVEILYSKSINSCWSCSTIPMALHINKEARQEAEKAYQLCFGSAKFPARIYFDFSIDTFYLGVGNFTHHTDVELLLRMLRKQELRQVRDFAIDDELYEPGGICFPFRHADYQTLTIIVSSSYCANDSEFGSHESKFHGDIVLKEVDNDSGELQAWSMDCLEGEPAVIPWQIPKGSVTWPYTITEYWSTIEIMKWSRLDSGIMFRTFRFVRDTKLYNDEKWWPRLNLTYRNLILEECGCMFPKFGMLEKLLMMHEDYYMVDQKNYWNIFCDMIEEQWRPVEDQEPPDPIQVYAYKYGCTCPMRHPRRFFMDEWGNLNNIDLEGTYRRIQDMIRADYEKERESTREDPRNSSRRLS